MLLVVSKKSMSREKNNLADSVLYVVVEQISGIIVVARIFIFKLV